MIDVVIIVGPQVKLKVGNLRPRQEEDTWYVDRYEDQLEVNVCQARSFNPIHRTWGPTLGH